MSNSLFGLSQAGIRVFLHEKKIAVIAFNSSQLTHCCSSALKCIRFCKNYRRCIISIKVIMPALKKSSWQDWIYHYCFKISAFVNKKEQCKFFCPLWYLHVWKKMFCPNLWMLDWHRHTHTGRNTSSLIKVMFEISSTSQNQSLQVSFCFVALF